MEKRDLPLGFGMALAQNETAMTKFAALSESEKQAVIRKTRNTASKAEMQALVDHIAKGETV